MAHPIYAEPNSASFQVAAAQYASLQAELHGDSRASHLVLDPTSGSATVENVDFSWAYDGTSNLVVTIVKKHGLLTEHYPNAAIFDTLQKQLLSGAPYTTGQVKGQ